MLCPSFLPAGTPRATPVSPSPSSVRRGNGVLLVPPAKLAVGYLWLGDTRSQRNHWDFGVGRQKETAKNRWRGSAGAWLCSMPLVALLGVTFHWQCPQLWSSGVLGHHHPSTTILGSPSRGHRRRRASRAREGHQPSCTCGNPHWAGGESWSQGGFEFK